MCVCWGRGGGITAKALLARDRLGTYTGDCIQRPVAVLYGLECGEVYGLGAVIRRLNPIRQT